MRLGAFCAVASLAAALCVRSPAYADPTVGRLVKSLDELQPIDLANDMRLGLAGDSLRFPVRLAPGAVLRTAFGVAESAAKGAGGNPVEFTVTLVQGGKRNLLFQRRVGRRRSLQWSEIRLTLRPRTTASGAELHGEVDAELLLEGKAVRDAVPPESIAWEAPRIEPAPRGDGPNLVLISLDTLRADHLGCYGYERDTSPNIDRLAREGVLFEHVISTSSWTLPAHASMLTGLIPTRHNAVRPDQAGRLAPEFDTLAELLWKRGYTTAAYTGHVFVTEKHGFDQGFERFRGVFDGGRVDDLFGPKLKWALNWMDQARAQRFFLFLHSYAAHVPYKPEPPFRRYGTEYEGPYRESFTAGDLSAAHDGHDLSEEQVRHLEALYDGGIAHLDFLLGKFLDGMATRGLTANTCIVVTSDHGEEFREHGELLHHHATLFDEVLHVPLIVWCPSEIATPRRIDSLVSLVDVTPTILALAGAPIPPGLDGVDLSPQWRGEAGVARPVVSEVNERVRLRSGASASLRSDDFKLIESWPPRRLRLYDLRADPAETRDVARQNPRVVKRMVKELHARQRAGRLARGAAADVPGPADDLDAATRERLRALGYIE